MLFWEKVDIALNDALFVDAQLYLCVNRGNVHCFEKPNSKSRIKTVIPVGTSLLVSSIHNQDNDPNADKHYACVQYFDIKSQQRTFGYVSLQSTHLDIMPIKIPMKYEDGQDYVY